MSLLLRLLTTSLLLAASLACAIPQPNSAPPTAVYVTQTDLPTATVTQSPTPSPTSSIEEVTPVETPSIIEVGTPIGPTAPPPGVIVVRNGWYIPHKNLFVRECGSLSCEAIPLDGLYADVRYSIQGWVIDYDSSTWVCLTVIEDIHGGQLCPRAAIYKDQYGNQSGEVIFE